jgi:hypothetical protein
VSRIRLRYVNAFANRNRKKQRMRYYFRRRGQKAIPLPGLPGSDEFMAAYAAALNMVPEPVEVGASRTLPGTINALCVSYYRSIEWSQLNATTQAKRKRVIERFRERHGTKRVATLQPAHIEMMLNKIETAAARRYWWTQIKPLLKCSVPMFRKDDPTLDIARIRIKSKGGHHCWSDDEVAQYRAHWPWVRSNAWCSNSHWRRPRAAQRSCASARSTSVMGAFALTASTVRGPSIFRLRPNSRRRSTPWRPRT